jgi:hypothetical protein
LATATTLALASYQAHHPNGLLLENFVLNRAANF